MDTKKKYHGFTLVKKEKIDSISSVVHLFKHDKTGAELLFVKNKDPELMYTLSFKTPADDDTGKSHIFEHATMMGSKKYPVRDAFVGMLRGAHTSFLNAMTFPDKTVYPVGSTNKEEFKKLVDVYTDLAFNPSIYQNKNIFLQEGVRFEYDEKNQLSLNGVVFNEMIGRLSSPERQLETQGMNVLFPDTTYQYCSGGLPEAIPALTFDELLEYHQKCYHPSNAHFFFYGNLQINQYLNYLDKEYLSKYKKQRAVVITKQPRKRIRDTKRQYTSSNNYEQHSYGFLLGDNMKLKNRLAYELLLDILMGDSHAPLKKACIDSDIAQDYEYLYEDEIQDLFVLFYARNAKKDSSREFKKLLHKTLKDLVAKGISEDAVENTLKKYELQLRSSQNITERGLHLFRIAETAWLYGGDPVSRLAELEKFNEIKHTFTPKFFAQLIEKVLQENHHSSLLTLTPTRVDLQKKSIEYVISKKKKVLSKKKKDALISEVKELKFWQKDAVFAPFTDFFPTLGLDKIPDQSITLDIESMKKNTITYVYNKSKVGELAYASFWFDISHLSPEQVGYATFISRVLTESPTDRYSAQEIQTILDTQTVGFGFSVNGLENKKREGKAYLILNFSYMPSAKQKVYYIVSSLLNDSLLDGASISVLLQREISRVESDLSSMSAARYARTRTFAKFYSHGVYEEYSEGISYLQTLRLIEKNIKKSKKKEHEVMKSLYNNIFTSKGMFVAGSSSKNTLQKDIVALQLDNKSYKSKSAKTLPKKSEIFTYDIMSNYNSYAVKSGSNNKDHAIKALLGSYLNAGYLWEKMRDLGGAYGGKLLPTSYDDMMFGSWQDPRIEGSFQDFKNVKKFLQQKDILKSELHQAQVSLFSSIDAPATKTQRLEREVSEMARGRTRKERDARRKYIKNISKNVFLKKSQDLTKDLSKGVSTTIARSDTSTKIKKTFDVAQKI